MLALPYIGIVALIAALTIPAPWRGLQPIDGWIALAAYLVFLAQAVFRGRQQGQQVKWTKKGIGLAVAGVVALGAGTYFTVLATQNIVSALGISALIGGLFITSPVAMLPQAFTTWSVTKSGQMTSAITSVVADHGVTMTLDFLPLALVTLQVQDFRLFWVNLT